MLWSVDIQDNITVDEWKEHFVHLGHITKSTKLRFFQYRLSNRKLVTNMLRHKWDNRVDKHCTFCQIRQRTVLHLIWTCPIVQSFWKQIQRWLNYMLQIQLHLNPKIVLLNGYEGSEADIMINLAILITKQYIYACKCQGQRLMLINWANKLYEQESLEMMILSILQQVEVVRAWRTRR